MTGGVRFRGGTPPDGQRCPRCDAGPGYDHIDDVCPPGVYDGDPEAVRRYIKARGEDTR